MFQPTYITKKYEIINNIELGFREQHDELCMTGIFIEKIRIIQLRNDSFLLSLQISFSKNNLDHRNIHKLLLCNLLTFFVGPRMEKVFKDFHIFIPFLHTNLHNAYLPTY